jgi:hypothetical protein
MPHSIRAEGIFVSDAKTVNSRICKALQIHLRHAGADDMWHMPAATGCYPAQGVDHSRSEERTSIRIRRCRLGLREGCGNIAVDRAQDSGSRIRGIVSSAGEARQMLAPPRPIFAPPCIVVPSATRLHSALRLMLEESSSKSNPLRARRSTVGRVREQAVSPFRVPYPPLFHEWPSLY